MTIHDGYRELHEHGGPGCFVSINETVLGHERMSTWYGCCIIRGKKDTPEYVHASIAATSTVESAVRQCKDEWDALTNG